MDVLLQNFNVDCYLKHCQLVNIPIVNEATLKRKKAIGGRVKELRDC